MKRHTSLATMVVVVVLLLSYNLYSLHVHIDADEHEAFLDDSAPTSPLKTQIYLFDSSTLSLRGVKIKDLNKEWTKKSNYEDLLRLAPASNALHPKQALVQQQNAASTNTRVVMLWHAVPKTAGTTVRKAIFKHIATTCPNSGEAATQQGAFRDVKSLHRLIASDCHKTHDYGLGGRMTFKALNDDSNIAVVHTIAFRPYEDWTRSALNQVVKAGGLEQCDIVRERLEKCEDYRELSFYQYTKMQLKRIWQHSLSDRDIVVVYNYRDTDLFHREIRSQLQLPLLKLEIYNTNRTTEMCPNDVLNRFYKCHEL